MAKLEQGKGALREGHPLEFTEDGKGANCLCTQKIQKQPIVLGPPIPKLEDLIVNPWYD